MRKNNFRPILIMAATVFFLSALLPANAPAGQSLYTYYPDNHPFIYFKIYDKGEVYGMAKFDSEDDASDWTLDSAELSSIAKAAGYWADLLGPRAKNNDFILFTVGAMDSKLHPGEENDYSGADDTAVALAGIVPADPTIAYTEPAAAVIADYKNPRHEPLSAIRLGTDIARAPGAYNGPITILPQNGAGSHVPVVLLHEIGHGMGIASFTENRGGQFYFKSNLTSLEKYFFDKYGMPAEAGGLINTSDPFLATTVFTVIPDADGESKEVYFAGPQTLSALNSAGPGNSTLLADPGLKPYQYSGLPINALEGGETELSHLELERSMMSHQNYRNYGIYMEAELALLQDIGFSLDRKNFFGYSIYSDDNVYVNNNPFYTRSPEGDAWLPGQYNDSALAIGLHLYGSNNTIYQNAEILSSGYGANGIRMDGSSNTLFINPGIRVHADGVDAVGLLVAYGAGDNIVNRGEIRASGQGGIGARFDFGSNLLGDDTEERGSFIYRMDKKNMPYAELQALGLDGPLVDQFDLTGTLAGQAASVYISPNAYVKEINVMRGARLQGDIISDWNPFNEKVQYSGDRNSLRTTLTFGQRPTDQGLASGVADPDFYLNYAGRIEGRKGLDVDVVAGTLDYQGDMNVASFTLRDKAVMNFSLVGPTSGISADTITMAKGSTVGLQQKGYFFAYGPEIETGYLPLLRLETADPGQISNESAASGEAGAYTVGFYDYEHSAAAWNGERNVFGVNITSRAENTILSGKEAVSAPLAIAARNPTLAHIDRRMARRFADANRGLGQASRVAGLLGQYQSNAQSGYALDQYLKYNMNGKNPYQNAVSPALGLDDAPASRYAADGSAEMLTGRTSIWLAPAYSYTHYSGSSGYNIKNGGGILGVDHWFGDNFFVGAAFSASWPEYESGNVDIEAKAYNISLYGGLSLPYDFELGLRASYGHTRHDQERHVYGFKYDSDYDSNAWSAGLNLARPFSVSESWVLRPFVSYDFIALSTDSYNEGDKLFALDIDADHNNLHQLKAGLDAVWTHEKGAWFTAGAYYAGLYGDTRGQADVYFNLDPGRNTFNTMGTKMDENALGLGLSAGVPLNEHLEVSAGYNAQIGKKSTDQNAYMGFLVRF